jgi:glycogen(starch) synthase
VNSDRRTPTDQRLRILAVGNMYPPHHAGGYELAWQAVMHQARAVGHEVRIVVSDYRADEEHPGEDPDVHRSLRIYWDPDRYEFTRAGRLQRVLTELHNAVQLRGHLRSFRPSIVTWWSMGCMSLSMIEQVRLARIPAVFVIHDDWLVYGWRFDAWINTWREREALGRIAERLVRVPARVDVNAAGPLVFNSRYTLERARREGFGTNAATVVHPGIDERFLEPVPPRPWGWRIVYVGRLDRQKGVDLAIDALAYLPAAASLDIWGQGDEAYVEEMKASAARSGVADRVRFGGFVDADSLRSVYTGADVVVFPVRWHEPFGLVPLEAMGVGRPVVTTAQGGMSEYVRDRHNALVFPVDDPRELARCVERLAGDETLRRRLCAGGRETAAAYSAQRFAELTLEEIVRAAATSRK